MSRTLLIAASAVGLTVASVSPALAGPDEAIKYRHQLMEGAGAAMGGIFGSIKGDIDQKARMRDLTRLLAITASLSKDAFRQNTAGLGKQKTDAKPTIWTDWADFSKRMDDYALASAALAKVAAKNPKDLKAIGDAAGKVGAVCKGCHEKYLDE